ncbi:D-alanyl-D-alanine carboxypeptidase [Bacillus oleivorans]|uniref:D-alanyl-D-alanine carboxypeptidase n=1 Tax=Bacillus oleivorans TaxID=1448271 RepID=A0A285CMN8_9BACI|nr:D-alanyl-D-alanine carboxypeptidase family protein [Bacillus oleivorans]SNX68328.1 D-alanyl-D-alanine carboxypeptidase [Bacillus oleivorans]
MKKSLIGATAILLLAGCSHQAEKVEKESETIHSETVQDTEQQQHPANHEKTESSLTLKPEFFNEIEVINQVPTITNPENLLVLVNKEYALPADYYPDDLVRPNVTFAFGDQDIEKSYMRKEAANALEGMFHAAQQEGIELLATSGFRSYDTQNFLFQQEVENVGAKNAELAVALPGKSEHQTGLTMDITAESVGGMLTEEFENTKEGQWLVSHAHEFGFILRYPKGKEEITGYQYEPWHFRYVGTETAAVLAEKGWTFEEYFENVEKM